MSEASRAHVLVRVETELGDLTLAIFAAAAPRTAANFLAYVDGGWLAAGSVYRIVTPRHRQPAARVPASLIQCGLGFGATPPLPPIEHESTADTGLRHLHGTISMARLEPGSAASEFFICIGDQPELDFGGRRHEDGQGFAAFGRVVDGEPTLIRLYARAEPDHLLARPIALRACRRV